MAEKFNKSIALRFTLIVFGCLLGSSACVILITLLIAWLGIRIPPARMTAYLLISFGVSCLIGTILAGVVSKKSTRSYNKFKRALKEVANGNFDIIINEDEDGFLSLFAEDFNATVKQLKGLEIMRSEFITNLSHELKTPITSINGFSELLLADEVSEEERKEYAQIIYNESNRLLKLAKNTLLLSKLEGQSIVTEKSIFSFDDMVENSLILFEKEILAKNINLNVNLDRVNYYWDSSLLSQVVINLVSNAIKYSKQNGNISIELHSNSGYVFFSVKDDGVGMSKKTLAKIFDRYYQGDSSHKTEGNGLGLAIVKKIIDLCGGKIDVGSKEGEGSYFMITLPEKTPI